MTIAQERIPQNLEELKTYILSFNAQEQLTSTQAQDTLDYMAMKQSELYGYIQDIQTRIQPLRYKYNRLLSSLSSLEFDDNSTFEEKKKIFLDLREEVMAVLTNINELNKLMAPLQNLLTKIVEENQNYAKKFPQTLNAIPLPQSSMAMPKTQQLKTPNYEVTAKPLVANSTINNNTFSHSKKGSINTPSATIGSVPNASNNGIYNNPATIGSSGKRRSTKSTPQSISPYVNLHSAGSQSHHPLLQQQVPNSNNNTPSYMNTTQNNINTSLQNGNAGLKSLSPEDILKQSNLNTMNNRNSINSSSNSNSNNTGSNLINPLNLNFDFDNFDDFLK